MVIILEHVSVLSDLDIRLAAIKMYVSTCLLCLLVLPYGSGLILSMTKPNGDPDLTSIMTHVSLMEKMISRLQTQDQTTNTELTSVKGHVTVLEQTISSLQTQIQRNSTELAIMKSKWQATDDELVAVKAELRMTEDEVAAFKRDKQIQPDHSEFEKLKSEFELLKVSHSTLLKQINLTVIDSIRSDVKSNTEEIHMLKSQLVTTQIRLPVLESEIDFVRSKQNKTDQDVATNRGLLQSTAVDMKTVQSQLLTTIYVVMNNTHNLKTTNEQLKHSTSQLMDTNATLNQIIRDVETNKADISSINSQLLDVSTNGRIHSVETHLPALESEVYSIRLRLNKTDQDLAATRGLGQSTAADMTRALSELNLLSSEVNNSRHEMVEIKGKLDSQNTEVAFQVSSPPTTTGTLIFNIIDLNTGGGYNKTSGMFIAPVSGLYFLWTTVIVYTSDNSDYIWVYIYKGVMQLGVDGADIRHTRSLYEVVVTSVAYLNQGDIVHVSTGSSNRNALTITSYSRYGGTLIHTT